MNLLDPDSRKAGRLHTVAERLVMIMLLSLFFGRAIAEELAKDQKCAGLKSMALPAPDHF